MSSGSCGDAVGTEPTEDELSALVYFAGIEMPQGRLGDSPTLTSFSGRSRSKCAVLVSSNACSSDSSSGGGVPSLRLAETAEAQFCTLVSAFALVSR